MLKRHFRFTQYSMTVRSEWTGSRAGAEGARAAVLWSVVSIFYHYNILTFDILFSIFYFSIFFDNLCSIFRVRYITFNTLSVDILRLRYFAFRYYAIRYFAYSIFCVLVILRLRYSAISILAGSIFCFRYLAFNILRFDIWLSDILPGTQIHQHWKLNFMNCLKQRQLIVLSRRYLAR